MGSHNVGERKHITSHFVSHKTCTFAHSIFMILEKCRIPFCKFNECNGSFDLSLLARFGSYDIATGWFVGCVTVPWENHSRYTHTAPHIVCDNGAHYHGVKHIFFRHVLNCTCIPKQFEGLFQNNAHNRSAALFIWIHAYFCTWVL